MNRQHSGIRSDTWRLVRTVVAEKDVVDYTKQSWQPSEGWSRDHCRRLVGYHDVQRSIELETDR